MTRDGLERYIATLDAAFDAAVAREEDEAASDLAFSLVQDRSLRERLARAGEAGVVVAEGRIEPVSAVGADYVAAGDPASIAVPLRVAEVVWRDGRGARPATLDGTLLELLRSWARAGAGTTIDTIRASWNGRLVAAGRDHVVVRSRGRDVAVALGALVAARRDEP
ncbi:MAG TPA: hypothetical protein VHJ34_01675 [Actinomycetota bacterium]|nr:hypothetical protein [Actinomycetota bacterium]